MKKLTVAQLGTVRKAIIAFVTAGIGSLTTALADGSLSAPEILTAVLTAIVATLAVYAVPNDPSFPAETPVDSPDAGA